MKEIRIETEDGVILVHGISLGIFDSAYVEVFRQGRRYNCKVVFKEGNIFFKWIDSNINENPINPSDLAFTDYPTINSVVEECIKIEELHRYIYDTLYIQEKLDYTTKEKGIIERYKDKINLYPGWRGIIKKFAVDSRDKDLEIRFKRYVG